MSEIARAWNGEVLTVAPVDRDFEPRLPTTKMLFDIRTDALLDIDISLAYEGRPVVDHNAASGLVAPTYSGTIVVADMNHVIEIDFDTPIKLIRWTASSPSGKKLYLAFFDLPTRNKITT